MDLDSGEEMARDAAGLGDGGFEQEEPYEARPEGLDDDDDDPTVRLESPPRAAEHLAAVDAFTRLVYLRRSGNMEVRPLSKANCGNEGSALAPYASVFSLPPAEKMGPLLAKMTKVLRDEKNICYSHVFACIRMYSHVFACIRMYSHVS